MEEHYGFKPELAPSAPFVPPPGGHLPYPPNDGSSIYPPSLSYPMAQNPIGGNTMYPHLNNTPFPPPPQQSRAIDHNNLGKKTSEMTNHSGAWPTPLVCYITNRLIQLAMSDGDSGAPITIHQRIAEPLSQNGKFLAYRWVDSASAYGSVPPTAVQGGMDVDGHPIYVGRAYHEGNLLPAKVIPGKNVAYVAHDGEEHEVENYQILCQQHFEWVSCQAGTVPHGAIQGGHTSEGEPLYIGRAYHEGSQTVGKIHPSHGVCYIPFDGEEVAVEQYEALVLRL